MSSKKTFKPSPKKRTAGETDQSARTRILSYCLEHEGGNRSWLQWNRRQNSNLLMLGHTQGCNPSRDE
ncbi:unnamed protein product [Clavelina lepadiformis]|uniref:Uncharacterized protein n=1 Tax=Clavelina lepadiformis TaxID=159417 RepID=A0ABP0FDS2_CLALP